ncbi:MAG: YgjV family protein [Alphaproteobacteria bacterium]|nr:YgjV family protein [Alphaproteobacteria bacterium]
MEIMGDWGSAQYITSQVFTGVAYILLAATYFITTRWKQLATTMTSNVTMGIGFALLGGWVAVGMVVVALARDTVSSIINVRREKKSTTEQMKNTRSDWAWLALWISAITVIMLFTHEGFMTMFAYFATLTFTISIWQKNPLIYRLLGVLVGIFWIIYNVVIHSFVGMTLESALLIFVIAGTIVYIKNMKNKSIKK